MEGQSLVSRAAAGLRRRADTNPDWRVAMQAPVSRLPRLPLLIAVALAALSVLLVTDLGARSTTPRPASDCPAACDDGNPCTTDTCDTESGTCVYTAVVCNDHDGCTTDVCDPAAGGCVSTFNC